MNIGLTGLPSPVSGETGLASPGVSCIDAGLAGSMSPGLPDFRGKTGLMSPEVPGEMGKTGLTGFTGDTPNAEDDAADKGGPRGDEAKVEDVRVFGGVLNPVGSNPGGGKLVIALH